MTIGETVTNQVRCNWERYKRVEVGSVWWGRASPAYPRLELVDEDEAEDLEHL